MNSRIAAGCFAFAATAAFGYWAPTPIQQLSANSDCVVIGRVTQLAPNHDTHRVLVTLDVLSALKGQRHAGSVVAVDAPFEFRGCVIVVGADGKPLPPTFSSFRTGESCALFLQFDLENHALLRMVNESDAKFHVDWTAQRLWPAVFAGDKPNVVTLDEFTKLVRAGDTKPRTSASIWSVAPATFWAPTPIERLAADSDCVVIGRVKQLVTNTNTHRVAVTMDELMVLKGFEHAKDTVTFDAPINMQYCYPFNSCTSNETCAVFLKFKRENNFKLSLISDSDGKFDIDWPAQHLRRANLAIMADDGENSLTLEEFTRKVKAGAPPRLSTLPVVADWPKLFPR